MYIKNGVKATHILEQLEVPLCAGMKVQSVEFTGYNELGSYAVVKAGWAYIKLPVVLLSEDGVDMDLTSKEFNELNYKIFESNASNQ